MIYVMYVLCMYVERLIVVGLFLFVCTKYQHLSSRVVICMYVLQHEFSEKNRGLFASPGVGRS